MAEIEEPQLCRLERRQQFRWFHRLAPVLVIQAYAAIYVIKLWDEYFDVTGMVRFGTGLLMVVLCMHLMILEGLLYVKTHATDCVQIYNTAMSQYASDPDRVLDPESLDHIHKTADHIEDKNEECSLLDREYSPSCTNIQHINVDVKTGDSVGYLNKESVGYVSAHVYLGNNERYPPVTSSSDSSWTEDSDSSSSQSSDCSSSSSSSSSYCDINGPNLTSTGAMSSSSSYCEIDVVSSIVKNQTLPISVPNVDSNKSTENLQTQSLYDMPTHDVTGTNKTHTQYDDITHQVDVTGTISMDVSPDVATEITKSDITSATTTPGITKPKLVDFTGAGISGLPEIRSVLCRLKTLQDVYVVIDVFKALMCLDVLRQLLVYYSIFYWRLNVIQTLPVFVLPSVAIIGEVSLTVVCFIT